MTQAELKKAKDKDLPGSLIAIKRAARMAREQAVRTNTAIVVMKGRKLVRMTSRQLRKPKAR